MLRKSYLATFIASACVVQYGLANQVTVLPKAQENKLFVSLGQDFGAGNSVEPTSLRSALVKYSGSSDALSGRVDFATLEANDLIQKGNI